MMKLNKVNKKFELYNENNDKEIFKSLKDSGVCFTLTNGEFFIENESDKIKAENSLK